MFLEPPSKNADNESHCSHPKEKQSRDYQSRVVSVIVHAAGAGMVLAIIRVLSVVTNQSDAEVRDSKWISETNPKTADFMRTKAVYSDDLVVQRSHYYPWGQGSTVQYSGPIPTILPSEASYHQGPQDARAAPS